MIRRHYLIFIIFLLLSISVYSQNIINLSGNWKVQLDSTNQGNTEKIIWHQISLPGSLAQASFGQKTTGSDFGILTPTHKYIGVAWYKRKIEIPKAFENKEIELFLERVLWESTVYIDGKKYDTQDGLGTPHIHKIGILKPGTHTLMIRVDNDMIYNIGDKGHAYGEYTQSIWNGIIGKMELQAKAPIHFTSVRTFSDIDNDLLTIELKLKSHKKRKSKISIEIKDLNDNTILDTVYFKEKIAKGVQQKIFSINLHDKLEKWSEFNPKVYVLNVNIKAGKYYDQMTTEFGFVKISHNKHRVMINNQPVFLRGNLDCIHFPLTGYPSTKIEDWIRIFKIYKSYGLNHVRFHSWCPPEAAFKAANRVGIYIQAEASIWIDWWMSSPQKRPEMNTKGYPKGLGKDPKRDKFVIAEMNRMSDSYGNNPSFTMFCIGNELGNSDFDIMKKWVADLKNKDPRRLYAISTARKITDVDDYSATHYIQGIGRTRGLKGAGTDWDFEQVYSKMSIPIIAHEIGQWPVYPSWKEIDKYSGVLKARNFEEFRKTAQKNGIDDQDEDFRQASGALSQIMYKYETESFLRTKSCAGVQLLSMQDYQGQGEALIGWLDAFWDSKGITTPDKFREHFNETVPLLRIEKFVWQNNEILKGKIQLSHFGNKKIDDGIIDLKITTQDKKTLYRQKFKVQNLKTGSLTDVGAFSFPLSTLQKAAQLQISITLKDTGFKNSWNIWVYPKETPKIKPDMITISEKLDDKLLEELENGKSILLLANNLGTAKNSVSVDFYPLYWSLTFFPGQGKTSIGTLYKENHPAFKDFPTSYHSDWQWETLCNNAKGFLLNTMPKSYKPIAQVVDDFHRNNKEGIIFEFKVGKGKLLICGYDLSDAQLPAARQLKYSLIKYMNSEDFHPSQNVSKTYLKNAFPEVEKAEVAKNSGEFKNIILKVDAAAKLKEKNTGKIWSIQSDSIAVAVKDASYTVKADGIWKDDNVSAWYGKKIQIEIQCPKGILGTLYVRFNDWNNKGREGFLEFEGRKVRLESHRGIQGKWIKFHVMREDSNDGKLILKTRMTKGGNLMISKMVLAKN